MKRAAEGDRGAQRASALPAGPSVSSGFPAPAAGRWRPALRLWWLPLAAAAVAALVAGIAASTQEPVFEATAAAVVAPSAQLTDGTDVVRGIETLERRTVVATFARLAETRETLVAAAARAGTPLSANSDLRVDAEVVPSTNVLRVRVEGSDARRTAAIANAVVAVTAETAARLYRVFALQPIESATPAAAPVRPRTGRSILLGALAGLALGVMVLLALPSLGRAAAARG